MNPIEWLLVNVLSLLSFLLLVYIIISLLISFNVVNARQQIVAAINDSLRKLFEPILGKIRGYIPNTGSIDFSPIVLFLLIGFTQRLILWAFAAI